MAGYISETMLCGACEHTYFDTLERDKRDETYACPECGEVEAKRTWSVPHVSTEKLSETIPDTVAKGRFAHHALKMQLKKAKSKARSSGDRESEKKINKEIKQYDKSRMK